jgi:sigma-B regulation protein RsbU (phosphoserine phosphatase)
MIRAVIVDDEAPARERLRRLLGGTLEVVGEASDGREALARIAELAPDVVFLDIQMPGPSGLEVAASLAAPRPRIIFCTAFDQFAIDAFEHHAVDYLLKPVNSERLAKTVARMSRQIEEQRARTRELREAARTQERLMPGAAQPVGGLEYAGRFRAAAGVGGDYYDFLPLGPPGGARLAIALGDVSGKGTYAALLVSALQARLQALAAGGVPDPARLMTELNHLTVGKMEGHRFATLFFAVWDGGARTLTYVNAGHPPALVIGDGAAVRELGPTGPVVGWSPDVTFEQRTVPLAAGDIVVIYSDGISEAGARAAGPEFGVDAIARAVRRESARPATAVVDAVMDEVDRFTGGAPLEDDRTVVVAKALA